MLKFNNLHAKGYESIGTNYLLVFIKLSSKSSEGFDGNNILVIRFF